MSLSDEERRAVRTAEDDRTATITRRVYTMDGHLVSVGNGRLEPLDTIESLVWDE